MKIKNIFKKKTGDVSVSPAKDLGKLIKLEKPLVIFNVETTGWSLTADRVIEISYVKIWGDGRTKESNLLLNPEIEITRESAEINGMKSVDLKNKPTFKKMSQELWDIFYNCNYGGFNITDFDLPILKREFLRAGMDFNYTTSSIIDSRIIHSRMEPRTLSSAYRHYCQKEYSPNSKNTATNVGVVTEIILEQFKKFRILRDWDFIFKLHNAQNENHEDVSRKFYWRNGEAYFNFSKYRDVSLFKVAQIDPEFLQWILGADFSEGTKNIVGNALRKAPKKRYSK